MHRFRSSAPASGAGLALLLALALATLGPARPSDAAPGPQGYAQQICGTVTDFRPPSPPITGAPQTAGYITINGVTLPLAPGANIAPEARVIGNNICFTPTLNAQNQIIGGTVTQNTVSGPTAAGNQLCGPISALQPPQGTAQGTITINGLTYALAPGTGLAGLSVGLNTCLVVTANAQNQIVNIAIASANPNAPAGAITVCGQVDEYSVGTFGGVGNVFLPGGIVPGIGYVPGTTIAPGFGPGFNPAGFTANATLGRLSINSTGYPIGPGVRPGVAINVGSFQCLSLTFADMGGGTAVPIHAVQSISAGPATFSIQHVCGTVTATTVQGDVPGGTITVNGTTYTLDPAAIPSGATVKPNQHMCFDFAISSGTTAVGVATYLSGDQLVPTVSVPLKWTATPPSSPTAVVPPTATPAPAPAAEAPPSDDPNAESQPVVPAAPPGTPSPTRVPPTPTFAPPEVLPGDTLGATPTPGLITVAPITPTPRVTGTTAVTGTGAITATATVTGTSPITATATVTATATPGAAPPPPAPPPPPPPPTQPEPTATPMGEPPPGEESAPERVLPPFAGPADATSAVAPPAEGSAAPWFDLAGPAGVLLAGAGALASRWLGGS